MKQLQIFLAFFRVGILGYGGGPSSIPLVHKEVVDKYQWMDTDEFGDILALGNALPGPIATKMAGYIGYRVGGVVGMLNALFATIVPTVILMVLLLTAFNTFKDEPWVIGMSKAVIPVVAVMLGTLAFDFIKKSTKSTLGWIWTLIIIAASLLFLEFINVHPAIIIILLFIVALFKRDSSSKKQGKKEKGTA